MESIVLNLKKQKQLLEIELNEYVQAKKEGRPAIHPQIYYAKLGHAYKGIVTAIKMLSSTKDDIYNNFKYIEQ